MFLDAITHGWLGPPRTGGLLLLATCAVACASTPPAPFTPPDPCTRVVPAIDGPVFTGPEGRLGRPFSLVVPEGFSPVDGMGIDSEVRLWVDGSGRKDYSFSFLFQGIALPLLVLDKRTDSSLYLPYGKENQQRFVAPEARRVPHRTDR